ncbi:unnamed protein product [Staurois parvus]|uniref:Uncharacterized protein n=1 Tax=Staurois parvus TaxID=386267 RepID=A0ABN9GH41_9NEOB|nr:unnamed protein product [Staurois parvus]
MARWWQSRGGLPFINSARHFGLCALLGACSTTIWCPRRTQWNTDRRMGPLCEVPIM